MLYLPSSVYIYILRYYLWNIIYNIQVDVYINECNFVDGYWGDINRNRHVLRVFRECSSTVCSWYAAYFLDGNHLRVFTFYSLFMVYNISTTSMRCSVYFSTHMFCIWHTLCRAMVKIWDSSHTIMTWTFIHFGPLIKCKQF